MFDIEVSIVQKSRAYGYGVYGYGYYSYKSLRLVQWALLVLVQYFFSSISLLELFTVF